MPQGQFGSHKELLAELDVLVGTFNTYSTPTQLDSIMVTSCHQLCHIVEFFPGKEACVASSQLYF